MGRAKVFTQVKEISETTAKRFEEITLYMFINQINKTENPDIIIEGLATAARCKRDSILRAAELFNNHYYAPSALEIAVYLSYYNVPIKNITNFDISERTFYRLIPNYIFRTPEEQDEITQNKFSEELLEDVVKFNKLLYNISAPFLIYEHTKRR